ncbi:hypothetical protein LR48_Vigan02g091000 [Vigna angularis]|uniref:Uncharacterized protein n=1 Tax=Phaseolus angularis TaxID=3914 RepID=A0A0L9TW33_PHAAN|nr:hypothetical protein LR48_Vigan02g091000 [Vigna angularis]
MGFSGIYAILQNYAECAYVQFTKLDVRPNSARPNNGRPKAFGSERTSTFVRLSMGRSSKQCLSSVRSSERSSIERLSFPASVRPDYERSSRLLSSERSSRMCPLAYDLKFSVERSAFERIHRTTSSSLLPDHSPPIRSFLPLNHCSFEQSRFRIKPYDFNQTILESRVPSSLDTSSVSPIQNLRIHGSNRFFSCFSVLQLDQAQISRRLLIQLKPSAIR